MRALGVGLASIVVTAVSACSPNGAPDDSCHNPIAVECDTGHPRVPAGPPAGAQLALELPSDLVLAPGAEQSVDLVVKVTKLPGTIQLRIDNPNDNPGGVGVSLPASVPGSDLPATRTVSVKVAANWGLDPVTTAPYHVRVRAEQGPNTSPTTVATMKVAYKPAFDLAVPDRLSVAPGQTADFDVDVVYAPLIGSGHAVLLIVNGGPMQAAAIPNVFYDARTVFNTQRLHFSVPVPANTPVGTYPLDVHGTGLLSGSPDVTHTVYIDVATVPVAPDFTLAPAANALVAARGATVTTRISITRTGAVGPVALSVLQPLPNDIRASFSDPAGAGSISDLTLAVGPAAPVGHHALVLRGVGAGTTHDYPFTLDVPAPPSPVDFTLQPAATTVTVAQNGSATLRIDAMRLSGPASQIDLTMTGQPATVSMIAAPILANGTTSTIVITAAQNAPAGSSTVTVTGTSGGVTRAATFLLTVSARGFTISAAPGSVATNQGSSVTFDIGLQWTGSSAPVALSTPGLPAGLSSTFVPPIVNGATASLTLDVAATMTPGTYSVTIQGSSSPFSASTTVQVRINTNDDFALQASPSVVPVLQLGTSRPSLFISRSQAFTSAVTLAVGSAPPGVLVTFSPASTTGTGTQLTVSAHAYTPPGTYPITVRGTAGAVVHTTSFLLVVDPYAPPSDFILDAESPLSIVPGAATGVTGAIGLLRAGGFTAPVQLSLSGLPSGVTATFAQNPMLGNTTTVRFVADQTVHLGSSITVLLTATAGGFSTTAQIRLQTFSP